MAVTAAETPGGSGSKSETRRTRKRTTLDDHVDRPSVVEPGDAPFDTTDISERAISVEPDKAAAARAGYKTVNAAIPMRQAEKPARDSSHDRTEKFQAELADGSIGSFERNIETGETYQV